MNKTRGDRHGAFTLIELLVVIAIIAILAALLLPSLGSAKMTAQGACCKNNIHQLALAFQLYCDDSGDSIPNNGDGQDGGGIFTNWVAGTMSHPQDATNSQLLVDQSQSSLARYLRNPKIFKCPGDKSIFVRSVSMNCRMNPTRPFGTPAFSGGGNAAYATFKKLQQIQAPGNVFVFLDERSDSINDGLFGVDMSNTGTLDGIGPANPYWMIDYPASYHNKAGQVSFADGHMEAHKWVEPTTLVPIGSAVPGSHMSATDRDVRWIQDHCTYLIDQNGR